MALAASTGVPGIDSLANWSDQFTVPGFDFNGNPQSVWPYTMVGTAPESGQTTTFRAPVIPVTVDLLDSTGKVAVYDTHPLTFAATPPLIDAVVKSPVYQPWFYTNGTGQINDQAFRAQFSNRIQGNGWHTLLAPTVRTARRIQVPFGSWYFFTDAKNKPVAAAIDVNVIGALLFPSTYPFDSSTPVGAAELAGDITTHDISSFMVNNVYLYFGDIGQCCALGFHTYDLEPGTSDNGGLPRLYVLNYSSWVSPGFFAFGSEDITTLSHEIAETFNDPFGNNQTPWWESVDPVLGNGRCQDDLEVGDVLEVLSGNQVFPISMNGRTYHPQNEALFNWFASQSPSTAPLHAYSFPDETTLTSLSPGNLLPGCVPAP